MDTLSPLAMEDITEELGVSITTVSRTLKGSPSISKEQREKIQAYAREHNLYPNVVAESLRSSKVKSPRVISVIAPQLPHFYFFSIFSGIEKEASAHSHRIMVAQSNEEYDREVRICQDYSENKVCSITVSQAKDTIRHEHLQKLINHGMPLMFYNRICMNVECSRVVVDDYIGVFSAVTHLIQTGCRYTAYYGTLTTMEVSKSRYNGYRDAIAKYGLKVDDRLFRTCDNRADVKLITPELLNQEEAPDAFFAVNDGTAVSVLYTAKRMGYRIPKDISICGFTNGNRAKACDPMLTTVEQRGVRVDEETANILTSHVGGFISPGRIEKGIMRTKLVTRGTMR